MKKRIVKKSAREGDSESLVTPEFLTRAGASALQPLLDLPLRAKRETPSPESQIVETVTPQTMPAGPDLFHRLSFSHLAELLELTDDTQRRFYEIECIRGNWSVRELRRQIDNLYYQRSGLLKNEALVEFALGDLPNKLFVSRYAVEMPKKQQMEAFLKQLGTEIGDAL